MRGRLMTSVVACSWPTRTARLSPQRRVPAREGCDCGCLPRGELWWRLCAPVKRAGGAFLA